MTLLASNAFANPTSRLVYVRASGAESCPDDTEMRRAVATRLGYDPFRPIASTTLTAEIRREKGVFRGRVRLVDEAGVERGARDLESRADDCRELTTAMALSMSIAIDPLSLTRPAGTAESSPPPTDEPAISDAPHAEPDAPVTAPPGAPSSASADRPAPSLDTRDETRDPARFVLGAGVHVAFGIAPAAAVGFRISTEVATRRYAIALEGRFDLPSSSDTAEGGRVRTSLAGGAIVPCVRVPLAWACGVLLVARVAAESVDVTSPRSDGFLFLGAGARLVTAIPLPESFSLRIGGDVLAHPVPFELTVNGRSVHRSSTVSALAGIALAHNF
ncbi:MAG: hypothetical protein QOI41_7527 [Myxococcales bacterium]|nr:hypothetical protein [Myxococcales bacterium]